MRQHSAVILALGLAGLAGLAGCGLVVNGIHQEVSVTSTPAGADVSIDGRPAGPTPLQVNLSRRHSHQVEVSLPGYVTAHAQFTIVENEYSRRTVRFGADIDSGAGYDLVPASLDLTLVPVGGAVGAFDRMKAAVAEADRLLEEGKITDEEHHRRIEEILARFAPSP